MTVLLPLTFAAALQAQITPAYTFTGSIGVSAPGDDFSLGMYFTLNGAVTVNALGYYANGEQNQQGVDIWDAKGDLLVSTMFSNLDPVVDGYAWNPIVPLKLAAGDYVIAGIYPGAGNVPEELTGINTIPQFVWTSPGQAFGPGLNFPSDQTNLGYGTNSLALPNFSVGKSLVPDVNSTLALLGASSLLLGFIRKRR